MTVEGHNVLALVMDRSQAADLASDLIKALKAGANTVIMMQAQHPDEQERFTSLRAAFTEDAVDMDFIISEMPTPTLVTEDTVFTLAFNKPPRFITELIFSDE